jgi:hypothetical protein
MEKMNNIDMTSKIGFYEQTKGIFSNPILVSIIVLIGMAFMGYAFYVYYYAAADSNVQANSSYYGKDITTYEPLFQ